MNDGPRKLDLGEHRERGYDVEFIEELINAVERINMEKDWQWMSKRLARKFPEVFVEIYKEYIKEKRKSRIRSGYDDDLPSPDAPDNDNDVPF